MYALILEIIVLFVWAAFLQRIFVNLKRNSKVKENTQIYHEKKLSNLEKQLYEIRRRKETEATETREAGKTQETGRRASG